MMTITPSKRQDSPTQYGCGTPSQEKGTGVEGNGDQNSILHSHSCTTKAAQKTQRVKEGATH